MTTPESNGLLWVIKYLENEFLGLFLFDMSSGPMFYICILSMEWKVVCIGITAQHAPNGKRKRFCDVSKGAIPQRLSLELSCIHTRDGHAVRGMINLQFCGC